MAELSVRTTTNACDQKWKRQRERTIIQIIFLEQALDLKVLNRNFQQFAGHF